MKRFISFEKIKRQIRYPDFLNLQISSFKKFISYNYKQKTHKNDGLTKLFNKFFPIKPYKIFNIFFKGYYLSTPLHSKDYCLDHGLTYSVNLIGRFQLLIKVKRLRKESKTNDSKLKRINENIFLCHLPYMTPNGSFIFNGYEKIIVSQLIKASDLFFGELSLKNGYKYSYGHIISNKGILLQIISDNNNLLNVILYGNNKFYLTTFLRAIGYSYDDDILNLFKLSQPIGFKKQTERYIIGKRLAGKVLIFWFEDFVDDISGEIVTVERTSILLDRNLRINNTLIQLLKSNNIQKIFLIKKEDYNSKYSRIYNILKRDPTNSQEEALIYILQKTSKNSEPLFSNISTFNQSMNRHSTSNESIPNYTLSNDATSKNYATPKEDRAKKKSTENHSTEPNSKWNNYPYKLDVDKNAISNKENLPISKESIVANLVPNSIMSQYSSPRATSFRARDYTSKGLTKNNGIIKKSFKNTTKKYIYTKRIPGYNLPKPKNITFLGKNIVSYIDQISLSKRCRLKLNKRLKEPNPILTITYEDILAIIDNVIALSNNNKEKDDLEHLSNKSVNTIEEQLKAQFSLGLSKILTDFKEQILKTPNKITPIIKHCHPTKTIKAKFFNKILQSYFSTNPFVQLLNQLNPLTELTQKRRLSYLGTGGLSRERASYDLRDINYSYYGKLCPIETPEGPNIGLISSLCVFAEVNSLGDLITPYLRVNKGKLTKNLLYLSSEDEIGQNICQLSNNKFFYLSKKQICRINSDYQMIANKKINFMEVASNQMASISVSLIPFLEHDDANRALMGSNMMRQAVPLVKPDRPIVYTGMEKDMMKSTRNIFYSKIKGIVNYVNSKKIFIVNNKANSLMNTINIYSLPSYKYTNKNTCLTLNPIVKMGANIKKGQVLSEGFATKQGELALGKNIRVAFMPFQGYNFEDAIVVSEKLIKKDAFTSINLMKILIEEKENKEKKSRKIPNLSKKETKHLDKTGIVKLGSFINPGKIIVGKISKVFESEIRPENKLLRAILGDTKINIKDFSVRAGPSIKGIVIRKSIFRPTKRNHTKTFLKQAAAFKNQTIYLITLIYKKYELITNRLNPIIPKNLLDTIFNNQLRLFYSFYKGLRYRSINQLPTEIEQIIAIYIADKRKLKVGDKISGRHGNKGVVAKIVKEENMPFLADGTLIDMVLNPLGVQSRMNLGQIYETITGEIGYKIKRRIKSPIFHCGTMKELFKYGQKANIAPLGKTYLYNGETGDKLIEKTTVGILYMLKLGHLVDDKMHARSIGPYSLITQQPLRGKSQFGGQRFGEMEVWALEAFGASNILQELLTIKSDDIKGRIKTYESISKGFKLPNPSMPESLRVLKNELKGLCLNLKFIK